MVSQISNEINPLGAPLEVESVENNPVRAGAQLFSDGGQFLHAAKGSNPRCRFQLEEIGVVERRVGSARSLPPPLRLADEFARRVLDEDRGT
jgi:hypothetical protein